MIFTSDNGPWLTYGNHAGSAGPLREGKGTTLEGGVRVPCVMRWPGKIPAGAICREPAMTIDLLPTLAKLAGAELPDDRIIDGKDICAAAARRAGAKSPHEAYLLLLGPASCRPSAAASGSCTSRTSTHADAARRRRQARASTRRRDDRAVPVRPRSRPRRDDERRRRRTPTSSPRADEARPEHGRDDLGDSLTNRAGQERPRPPGHTTSARDHAGDPPAPDVPASGAHDCVGAAINPS